MPTDQVKPNRTFGAGGKYKAGDRLQLSEEEAKPFLDKLELVSQAPVGLQNELGVKVPDDLKLMPGEEETAADSDTASPGLRNDLGVEIDEDLKLLPEEEPEPKKSTRKTQRKANR
jgi:hypothetical protein